MTTPTHEELALVCHPRRTIERILSCDLGPHVKVGVPLTELLLAESWVRCQHFLHVATRQGAALDCELTVLAADGALALRFVALRISPDALIVVAARDAETLLSLLGAACAPNQGAARRTRSPSPQRALDELTRINSELVNGQRELAKRHAAKDAQARQRQELLATIAHDLRTPMAAVLGYCELLGRTGCHGPDPLAGMMPRVCESVRYALSLLGQTLDYARAESGSLTLCLVQTDLHELASSIVEMHRPLAAAKDIRIELVTGSGAIPPIWLDRVLIQQAVGNLLTNAIKYSPPDTQIEVRLRRHDGNISICVQDQGLGIEPKFLPLVFRPFQTTSTKGTAGEKSTGLGLAIVQKLIEAHGGTVDVQSAPQQGSTFVVTLPIKVRDDTAGVMVLPERGPLRSAGRQGDTEKRS